MTTRFIDHLLKGDHASRPAFGDVPEGTLYACSDHSLIYQSDGSSAWSTWATLGGDVAAHTGDATDAHDASAISVADSGGNFTGTDVETVLAELAASGGGSGGGWTQVIDEDGSSFANFTAIDGTWASTGTVIQQTDTTDSIRRARHNTKIASPLLVAEVEVNFPSSGPAVCSAGLVLGWPGTSVGNYLYAVLVDDATNTFQIGTDGSTPPVNETVTVARDTWYKVRAVKSGVSVAGYLDGTLIGAISGSPDVDVVSHFVGLRVFDGTVQFRNFKVWTPTLPA